jgi:hypothetical protein
MHKLVIFINDGSQKHEEALWTNANAAKLHAEEQLKWKKSIHMIQIVPQDGTAPINVIRQA